MAKKLLTSYTFTPGAANAGTVVVAGTYALEQFLLITNVTDGVTIFQFNKPSKGGTVSTGGGNTTLTIEADTSSMSAGDRLQVFVDDGQNPQFTLTNASVEISNDAGNAVPVSAAALPLPSGAATAANQSTANASLASIDGKAPALVSGRVPVDGSGVTQPVSGPLTNTELRATPVPVSGTVAISNSSVEVANDSGNPIPVGPAAQLNVTGSASANNTDLISVACDAYRSVNFQITGTWSGTISFQVSNDNVAWASINAFGAASTGSNTVTTTNNLFFISLSGCQFFRARFTGYTSGTASINAFFSKDNVPTAALTGGPTNTVVASTTSSATVLYTVNSAATTNAAVIKSTAANFYGLSAMNTSATTKYVRFYSKATAPTVGTDVPIMVVAVPATSSKEIEYVPALRIGTGLGVAITGGAAVNDATAVAAGDVQLLVSYA